ncbi:hypothetical protein [Raoultella terrigena]|uniref:hypothetical protein n=1 Tax=Raoultella terrigena TaxID=577 RepID=UPI0009F97EA5|nr:hypothetical protein [Raoultella terrigena]
MSAESVKQTFVEMGSQRAADTATINQMYVEYMRPQKITQPPVILIHGAGQSGSAWDTTPDGRMGWYEYFVRNGYPAYVIDQVGRARSGFNQAVFNNVAEGSVRHDKQPRIIRPGDTHALWINMRLGPEKGTPYPDSQFPVTSFSALSRTGIPDLSAAVGSPNPTLKNLSSLAKVLKGAILISHSQSGAFPLQTALLDARDIKAMVLIEPGSCENAHLSDAQVARLSAIPLLVVYGDHLTASTELPGNGAGWMQRKDECNVLISRFRANGGQADMFYLPEMGIHGNSHMMMMDKNNLKLSGLIKEWLIKHIHN